MSRIAMACLRAPILCTRIATTICSPPLLLPILRSPTLLRYSSSSSETFTTYKTERSPSSPQTEPSDPPKLTKKQLAKAQKKAAKRASSGPLLLTPSALAEVRTFFSQFPDFDYDPSAPLRSEWKRLCTFKNWNPTYPDKRSYLRSWHILKDLIESSISPTLLADALKTHFPDYPADPSLPYAQQYRRLRDHYSVTPPPKSSKPTQTPPPTSTTTSSKVDLTTLNRKFARAKDAAIPPSALRSFFESHPGFTYNPSEHWDAQHKRLCREMGWTPSAANAGEEIKRGREKNQAKRAFKEMMVRITGYEGWDWLDKRW